MSVSESAQAGPQQQQKPGYNPDEYRMSVGEHLEELRGRLIKSLIGFVVALGVCLYFGTTVISIFCRPLVHVLRDERLNTTLTSLSPGDVFGVWIQIALISAAVLASPLIVYQLWQFVAAGLYPHERKTVLRYVPLSITLLLSGFLFVYFFILPWTLMFFVQFTMDVPLPAEFRDAGQIAATQPAESAFPTAPILQGDKAHPLPGQFWFNAAESRLKLFVAPDDVRTITFGSKNLITNMYTLTDYIDLVLGMLLAFGLSFQMPLVVLALAKVGIVEVDSMKRARQYVYFALVIAAAAITPGSDLPSLIGLTIPLILLFELGIWMAGPGQREAV